MESFSRDLLEVVNSTEHMTTGTYNHLIDVLNNYFANVLAAGFYEVQLDGVNAGDAPGLTTAWSNATAQVTPIFKSQGVYQGQTTFAYDRNVDLWVTAKSKGLLREVRRPGDFLDSASHQTNIPLYWNYSEKEKNLFARTSIILILRHPQGSRFGFLNMEFASHIPFRPQAMSELRRLAGAIGALMHSKKLRDQRMGDVAKRVKKLSDWLDNRAYISPLTSARLFFAYPKNGDREVVELVQAALDDFQDTIERVDWHEDMHEPGAISEQIDRQIMNSTYGLCFVSERNSRSSLYRDNRNVLIEAGMMHALELTSSAPMTSWILIREENSPPLPFDFVNHRMIEVPRSQNGNLRRAEFAKLLGTRLKAMIKQT